jgi:ABC-type uncharacterized transport system substrate-binding protein
MISHDRSELGLCYKKDKRNSTVNRMFFKFHVPAVLFVLLAGCFDAAAHPHVYAEVKAKVVYDQTGAISSIRQEWKFDDAYSVYATQGLPAKQKGAFTRQELAPLAKANMDNLKDSEFFTHARVDGNKVAFGDPIDYWLEYKDSILTLFFTLPLKPAVKTKALELAIYDPMYFVDFTLAERDGVTLQSAPPTCKTDIAGAGGDKSSASRMGESYFSQLNSRGFGSQFASTIYVRCP